MWWKKILGLAGIKEPEKPELSVVVPAVFPEGEGENPLFLLLSGVPVVARTLQTLNRMPMVAEVIVVVREADLLYVADLCRAYHLERVKKIVTAARPGLEALATGVFACDRDAPYIAIHDPLRPFLTEKGLQKVLNLAKRGSAAVPAVAVKDTIKIVADNVVQNTPERSKLKTLQMPQIVESSLLKGALTKAMEQDFREDDLPAALDNLGLSMLLAPGSEENVRVAKQMDLPMAETIFAWRGYS